MSRAKKRVLLVLVLLVAAVVIGGLVASRGVEPTVVFTTMVEWILRNR